jgi:hypothetical protein
MYSVVGSNVQDLLRLTEVPCVRRFFVGYLVSLTIPPDTYCTTQQNGRHQKTTAARATSFGLRTTYYPLRRGHAGWHLAGCWVC